MIRFKYSLRASDSSHFLFLSAVFFLLSPFNARAGDATVTLQLPPDFLAKACSAPPWKDVTVLWQGVKDARSDPEIGRQTKKEGKDPTLILSEPPLDLILDRALRDLFSSCGIRLLTEGNAEKGLSVEIDEFYAGVEKRFLTGKSVAKSRLKFLVKRNGALTNTVEVGYELESRTVRQKGIKQLEKTLNELLWRTLEQIPQLSSLREL